MTMNAKLIGGLAICLACAATAATSAMASPPTGALASHTATSKGIQDHGGGQRFLTGGEGAAIGIGALIIGGVVLSEAARAEHRREHGGDWDRCARSHRTFDRDTGFYRDRDGSHHQCRYLR